MSARAVLVSLLVLLGVSIFSATASAEEVSGTWSKSGNKVTVKEKNNSGRRIRDLRVEAPANVVITEPGLFTGHTPPVTCPDSSIDSMLSPDELECQFTEWLEEAVELTFGVSDPKNEFANNPDLEEWALYEGATEFDGPYKILPSTTTPPPCGGGTVVKETCVCPASEVDQGGTCSPTPEETPCKCAKVSGFLNDLRVYPDSTRLTFKLNWMMTCTAGSGLGCNGQVSLLAPKGMFFVTPPVKGAKGPVRHTIMKVKCSGECAKSTVGTASFSLLAINLHNRALSPKGRGKGKSLDIVLQTACISPTGVLGAPTRLVLKVAFKPNGNVDYKTSDLNGDGRPDGGQLK